MSVGLGGSTGAPHNTPRHLRQRTGDPRGISMTCAARSAYRRHREETRMSSERNRTDLGAAAGSLGAGIVARRC